MLIPPITEEELTRALERTLVAHGKLAPEEARTTARRVLDYFGPGDSVLDNKLNSEDRDIFYRLEEEDLLSSEEEDATVSRGKTWRIHYWLLKKTRVREAGQEGSAPSEADAGAVYRGVDENIWDRGADGKSPPPG
ncbi:MAG TPA: DUF6015 family protein [Thermoplasmata archaeon]|nr:DUF6015 family protein [Thermoplasmata archaeon]